MSVGKEYRQTQHTVCKNWIPKRCSGMRVDLSRVNDSFRCRR